MDDKTALDMIEGYFAGKVSPADYTQALIYFADTPHTRDRLAALFADLRQPGGIDHEGCRALMVLTVDLQPSKALRDDDRVRFLIHMSRCADCSEEYRTLRNFERESNASPDLAIPRFAVPRPQPLPIAWPARLMHSLSRSLDQSRALRFSVQFSQTPPPAVPARNEDTPQSADQIGLFNRSVSTQFQAGMRVRATRDSAETCILQVWLEGPGLLTQAEGHTIRLEAGNNIQERSTNREGFVRFDPVPIVVLPTLRLDVAIALKE